MNDFIPVANTFLVCITVFGTALIFRNPLSKLIEKILSLQIKKTNRDSSLEVGIKTCSDNETEKEISQNTNLAVVNLNSEINNLGQDTEQNVPVDTRLWKLMNEGKKDEFESLYNEHVLTIQDDEKRFNFKNMYAYFRLIKGFDNDDSRFQQLIEENKNNSNYLSKLYYALSYCYLSAAKYELARDISLKILSLNISLEDKINAYVRVSEVEFKTKGQNECIDYLIGILKFIDSHEGKYRIFKQMYTKLLESNKELAFIALNKALYYRLNDKDDLFNVAYCSDDPSISLYYYKRELEIDPKNQFALNNLGVAYHNKSLLISSIETYEKAISQGNTLASSNLAIKYLDNGFYSDAKRILEEALKQDDIHENVHLYMSKLNEKKQSETKREKALIAATEILTLYYQRNALSFFEESDPLKIVGKYQINICNILNISIKDDESWNLRLKYNNDDYVGSISSRKKGFKVTLSKDTEYSILREEKKVILSFSEIGKCEVLVIESDEKISSNLYTLITEGGST